MMGISIYIWIRFEWQFGVGALGRLFHEVALTFGFFAITQIQFDLNSVAALLTIVGYSRSEEHTSELQSLMRISYAVFCLKKKKHYTRHTTPTHKPNYTYLIHNETTHTVSIN